MALAGSMLRIAADEQCVRGNQAVVCNRYNDASRSSDQRVQWQTAGTRGSIIMF